MNFEVQLTAECSATAVSIVRWIQKQSPDGARRWYLAYEKAVMSLRQFAENCGLAPEGDIFPEPVYEKFFKTRSGNRYRLLFVRRENVVYVFDVRGPGQNLANPIITRLPPS